MIITVLVIESRIITDTTPQGIPETVMTTTMIVVISEAVSEATIEVVAAVGGTTVVATMTEVEIENGPLHPEGDEVDLGVLPVDLVTGEI